MGVRFLNKGDIITTDDFEANYLIKQGLAEEFVEQELTEQKEFKTNLATTKELKVKATTKTKDAI